MLILVLFVREKKTAAVKARENIFKNFRGLGKDFHNYLKVAGVFSLAYFSFALAADKISVILLFLIYGVFYALDEAQTKAYISDITAPDHRASAIGVYNFITGIIYLPASLLAGWLWYVFSPSVAFGVAGVIALCSAVLFLAIKPVSEVTKKAA